MERKLSTEEQFDYQRTRDEVLDHCYRMVKAEFETKPETRGVFKKMTAELSDVVSDFFNKRGVNKAMGMVALDALLMGFSRIFIEEATETQEIAEKTAQETTLVS